MLEKISSSSNADVLILDLALNGILGIDVCHQIRRYDSSIGIIRVSAYSLDEYQQLAAAGAQGLFSKQDAFSSVFVKAIHAVASGECAECPGVLLSEEDSYSRLHAVPDDAAGISGGKLEIRGLCACGLPPKKEIGFKLHISCATVLPHVNHASRKLGVIKHVDAILICLQRHLIHR